MRTRWNLLKHYTTAELTELCEAQAEIRTNRLAQGLTLNPGDESRRSQTLRALATRG